MPAGSPSTGRTSPGRRRCMPPPSGSRMVFQELSDAPPLTVTENICLGRWPTRRGRVDWRAARERAVAVLARLGSDIDPDRTVRLAAHRRASDRRDRPGAVGQHPLPDPRRTDGGPVGGRVRPALRHHPATAATGVAIIYITHRLDEVRRIADRVQVLRDGATVLEGAVADHDRDALVEAMVGRPVDATKRPEATGAGSGCRSGHQGSATSRRIGRSPTSASNSAPARSSRCTGESAPAPRRSPRRSTAFEAPRPGRSSSRDGSSSIHGPAAAIRLGVGLLPGDRQREGAFMIRPVAENLCAASWPTLSRRGVITGRREAAAYRRWHDRLHIRSRNDPRQPMATLSGGNQQKVLLGRWLERDVRCSCSSSRRAVSTSAPARRSIEPSAR